MRVQLIAGGVIFLVVGVVFLFVPFSSQPVGVDQASSSAPYVFYEPGLTPGGLTFTVEWGGGSTSVTVTAYSCGSDTSCSGGSQYATSANEVGQASGSSNSFSFTGAPGTGYEVYASPSEYVDVSYAGPLLGGFLGLGWAVFGVILVLPGIFLKPSKKRAARGAAIGGAFAATPPPPPPPAVGPGVAGSSAAGIAGFTASPLAPPPPPPDDPGFARRK